MVQEFEKNLSPFVSVSTLSANIVQLDSLPSKKNDFNNNYVNIMNYIQKQINCLLNYIILTMNYDNFHVYILLNCVIIKVFS